MLWKVTKLWRGGRAEGRAPVWEVLQRGLLDKGFGFDA